MGVNDGIAFAADVVDQPFLRKIGKAPERLAKIPFKVTLPAGAQAP